MARVCLKRERLPSCLLIENDSAITNTAVASASRAEAFPIKASDNAPEATLRHLPKEHCTGSAGE